MSPDKTDDRSTGISMRFVKEWDIIPDPHPHAMSWGVCPTCGLKFFGSGPSLLETMAHIRKQWDEHECQP